MTTPGRDNQDAIERTVAGLAGAAFEGMETLGGGITAIWNFNKAVLQTVGQAAEPLRKPLDALGITAIVQRPVEVITQNVEVTVIRLEAKGRTGLQQTGVMTVEAVGATVDAVLTYLSDNPKLNEMVAGQIERLVPLLLDNPAVEELVTKVVALMLPKLKDDPTIKELIETQASLYLGTLSETFDPNLQALIRRQGDAYIDYLNAHPDSVKTLVQGQSMSLAAEVMDEVRERAVTADSVLEMIVRRVLGRKEREQLELPPQEVQRRAATSRLPSDFVNAPLPQQQGAPHPNKGNGYA